MKSHSRKKYRKVSPKIKKEIFKLYAKGKTTVEIGKKYKLNHKTIYYHLVINGKWRVVTRAEAREIKGKKIAKLYREGKKIPEIARQFKMKKEIVGQILVELGIYDFIREQEKDDKIKLTKEDRRKIQLLKLQSGKINQGKNYEDYFKTEN